MFHFNTTSICQIRSFLATQIWHSIIFFHIVPNVSHLKITNIYRIRLEIIWRPMGSKKGLPRGDQMTTYQKKKMRQTDLPMPPKTRQNNAAKQTSSLSCTFRSWKGEGIFIARIAKISSSLSDLLQLNQISLRGIQFCAIIELYLVAKKT